MVDQSRRLFLKSRPTSNKIVKKELQRKMEIHFRQRFIILKFVGFSICERNSQLTYPIDTVYYDCILPFGCIYWMNSPWRRLSLLSAEITRPSTSPSVCSNLSLTYQLDMLAFVAQLFQHRISGKLLQATF